MALVVGPLARGISSYFHDGDRDIDYEHGYKENFKDTFCHQK